MGEVDSGIPLQSFIIISFLLISGLRPCIPQLNNVGRLIRNLTSSTRVSRWMASINHAARSHHRQKRATRPLRRRRSAQPQIKDQPMHSPSSRLPSTLPRLPPLQSAPTRRPPAVPTSDPSSPAHSERTSPTSAINSTLPTQPDPATRPARTVTTLVQTPPLALLLPSPPLLRSAMGRRTLGTGLSFRREARSRPRWSTLGLKAPLIRRDRVTKNPLPSSGIQSSPSLSYHLLFPSNWINQNWKKNGSLSVMLAPSLFLSSLSSESPFFIHFLSFLKRPFP